MSAVGIIKELPKMTTEERSAVRRCLQALEEQAEMLFLHESADAMFQDMDKQEAKHAHHKPLC